MDFTLAMLLVSFVMLMVGPQWVSGLARTNHGSNINPLGSKPVKASIQKIRTFAFGCSGLDPGDANISCHHEKMEKRWGVGIDCTEKVPTKTQAVFLNCPPGYALVEDYKVITCKFPGNWDNDVFTCDEIPTTTTVATTTKTTTKLTTKKTTPSKNVTTTKKLTTTTKRTTIPTLPTANITTLSNGTIITAFPNGTTITTLPNGTIITTLSNGTIISTFSNGTIITTTTGNTPVTVATLPGVSNTSAGVTTMLSAATTAVSVTSGPDTTTIGTGASTLSAGVSTTTAGASTTTAGASTTTAGASTTTAGASTTTAGASTTTAGASTTAAVDSTTAAGATTTTAAGATTTTAAGATTTTAAGATTTTAAGATTTTAGGATSTTAAGAVTTTTGTTTTTAGGMVTTTAGGMVTTTTTTTTPAATTTIAPSAAIINGFAFPFNGKLYKWYSFPNMTANVGEALCVAVGSHLTIINDDLELAHLRKNVARGSDFYLGLNDNDVNGVLKTNDGSPVPTYLPWKTGNPTKRADQGCFRYYDDSSQPVGIIEFGCNVHDTDGCVCEIAQ